MTEPYGKHRGELHNIIWPGDFLWEVPQRYIHSRNEKHNHFRTLTHQMKVAFSTDKEEYFVAIPTHKMNSRYFITNKVTHMAKNRLLDVNTSRCERASLVFKMSQILFFHPTKKKNSGLATRD